MKLTVPPPPRELEEAVLSHGGHVLTLTVLRQAGKQRRPLTTTYAVERPGGADGKPDMEAVRLVKADGAAYTVTEFGCDCKDDQVRGRERSCKHFTGCTKVGLLAVASSTQGA